MVLQGGLYTMYFSIEAQSRGLLSITVSLITGLLVLINISFKLVAFSGLIFTASSLLCPIIAIFYLLALRSCSIAEQRHILNMALISLYLFSIGVYLLVNLPAAEYMHNNPAYQVVFEEIPKKFFATTLAFGLSFYLPHLIFLRPEREFALSSRQALLFMIFGGFSFFLIDFYFLFSAPHIQDFQRILIDSSLICLLLLLTAGVIFLAGMVSYGLQEPKLNNGPKQVSFYYYLLSVAVTVMLICVACNYRLVALNGNWILTANCLLFPIVIMVNTLVGELYGLRANMILMIALVGGQLFFDGLLMLSSMLPSPAFFNLSQFYDYVLPRRVPMAALAVVIVFFSNSYLLDKLKRYTWLTSRTARFFIANFCARTVTCLVSYVLFFTGVYSYEQMFNLAMNAWVFKNILEILALPLLVWFCYFIEKRLKGDRRATADRVVKPSFLSKAVAVSTS